MPGVWQYYNISCVNTLAYWSAIAWIIAPADKNSKLLKKAWFTKWNKATLCWESPTAKKIYPIWEIVLNAIIRFKSFCNRPVEAAKKAVIAPTHKITNSAVELYSNNGDDLRSK